MRETQLVFKDLESLLRDRAFETSVFLKDADAVRGGVWNGDETERRISELKQLHMEYGMSCITKADVIMKELADAYDEIDANIDFMNDPKLVNTLKLMELMDGDVPEKLLENLNSKYKRFPQAAKLLLACYKKFNVVVFDEDLDKYTNDPKAMIREIDDKLFYSFGNENPDFSDIVEKVLQLADVFGCKFDKSCYNVSANPGMRLKDLGNGVVNKGTGEA